MTKRVTNGKSIAISLVEIKSQEPYRMKHLILFTCLFFAANAFADKLVCDLSVSGKDARTIEGTSSVSMRSGIFHCRGKKEEGEIVRLRISSENNSETATDGGYRSATETLMSVDHQGDTMNSATCTCKLE